LKKLWHVCLFFFLFSSCTKNLCDVGDTKITSRDIEFRKRVSEVYYPGSGKDYVALAQLIKGYLSEEVLKSLGYKIDESILEGEAGHFSIILCKFFIFYMRGLEYVLEEEMECL